MEKENNYGQVNQQEEKVYELDLKTIFYTFARRWFIIIPIALIIGIGVGVYIEATTVPTYTSETSLIIIKHTGDQINTSDISVSNSLSNDYVSIVKSRTVLERVASDLEVQMTTKELSDAIKASIVPDTRIIKITATNILATEAKKIADLAAKEAKNRINEVMGVSEIEVNIVDSASLPTKPDSNGAAKYGVIAAIIGLLVIWIIFIIVTLTNDTIKTPDDIKRYLDCTVLGVIPLFDPETSLAKAPVRKAAEGRRPEGKGPDRRGPVGKVPDKRGPEGRGPERKERPNAKYNS